MYNRANIDANKIIILLGAVFGALISIAAKGTFLSLILGAIIGLAFAGFFVNVIIPNKPSDR